MSGMPWLKLYVTDVLDDPRFSRLEDTTKWTYIQLLALAGECDAGGALIMGNRPMTPAVIGWRLGKDPADLDAATAALTRAGYIETQGETLVITDFMAKQGPTQAEKREAWRKRQEKHRQFPATCAEEEKDKDKDKEEEEEVSHVTSPVTQPPPAAAFSFPSSENSTVDHLVSWFTEQHQAAGYQVIPEKAQAAARAWLDDIAKSGKSWRSENYEAIAKRYDLAAVSDDWKQKYRKAAEPRLVAYETIV